MSKVPGDRVEGQMVLSQQQRMAGLAFRMTMIGLALFFALFPIIWIIRAAFDPHGSLASRDLIPQNIESVSDLFLNFQTLLVDELDIYPFWNWVVNSLFVATTTTILTVLITALSAYSFSRFRFHGRRSLLLTVLLIQVFPNILMMVAVFLILQQIGRLSNVIPEVVPALSFINWDWLNLFALDSLGGLILVYMAGAMGINTWLMKGYFDTIPRDIDESAMVDGASHWQTFWMLIFPLVRPILAVVGVLAFVGTFNEFILARIILRSKENWTLMVGLYNFITADFARDWGKFAAGALVSAAPIVIVYLMLQDQIVGGLTQGAVKG